MGNIWISSWRYADLAGKLDLLAIAAFSLVSWYIIFEKFFLFREVRRKHAVFEVYLERGEYPPAADSPLHNTLDKGLREYRRRELSEQRLSEYLEGKAVSEMERVESNLGFLATTTVVCPFLGLLGTVWGLLIAFHSMAATGSSSIRVVASGVAEALITTVAGLLVAIPTSIAYNYFVGNLRKLSTHVDLLLPRMAAFIAEHGSRKP